MTDWRLFSEETPALSDLTPSERCVIAVRNREGKLEADTATWRRRRLRCKEVERWERTAGVPFKGNVVYWAKLPEPPEE